MENEENEKKTIDERLLEATERTIEDTLTSGIQSSNIDLIYKLTKIREKMKEEKEMRYNNYGNYGNRPGYDAYGRRGVDARYRGHAGMRIDDMYSNYDAYSRGREEYNRGNYGAKDSTLKSLEYMLESMVDFVEMLKQEANSQEEMELIRHYTHKISEM